MVSEKTSSPGVFLRHPAMTVLQDLRRASPYLSLGFCISGNERTLKASGIPNEAAFDDKQPGDGTPMR